MFIFKVRKFTKKIQRSSETNEKQIDIGIEPRVHHIIGKQKVLFNFVSRFSACTVEIVLFQINATSHVDHFTVIKDGQQIGVYVVGDQHKNQLHP